MFVRHGDRFSRALNLYISGSNLRLFSQLSFGTLFAQSSAYCIGQTEPKNLALITTEKH